MKRKSLAIKQVSVIAPDTPEYRIAVTQLNKLEDIAKARLFSADEARLYDILCKSLALSKESPLTSTATYREHITISEKELIDIARDAPNFEKLVNEDLKLIKKDLSDGKKTSE